MYIERCSKLRTNALICRRYGTIAAVNEMWDGRDCLSLRFNYQVGLLPQIKMIASCKQEMVFILVYLSEL